MHLLNRRQVLIPDTITSMRGTLTDSALLQLLRLSSPALPIGTYSYSQGLEYACESGVVTNATQAGEWFTGVMRNSLALLDIPLLQRMYMSWEQGNDKTAKEWSCYLLACRETSELRQEDRQTGRSLARLLRDLQVDKAKTCMDLESASLALSFSLAAKEWHVPVREAAFAYLWSWLENQVAAAIKLIPIGQTEGQRIISSSLAVIEECVHTSLDIDDEEISGSLPGLAITSSLHETQYSRLFQS